MVSDKKLPERFGPGGALLIVGTVWIGSYYAVLLGSQAAVQPAALERFTRIATAGWNTVGVILLLSYVIWSNACFIRRNREPACTHQECFDATDIWAATFAGAIWSCIVTVVLMGIGFYFL